MSTNINIIELMSTNIKTLFLVSYLYISTLQLLQLYIDGVWLKCRAAKRVTMNAVASNLNSFSLKLSVSFSVNNSINNMTRKEEKQPKS